VGLRLTTESFRTWQLGHGLSVKWTFRRQLAVMLDDRTGTQRNSPKRQNLTEKKTSVDLCHHWFPRSSCKWFHTSITQDPASDLIHTSFDHANRCLASTAPTHHRMSNFKAKPMEAAKKNALTAH